MLSVLPHAAHAAPANVQVALSATIQLDLGTTLLFSGVYNVASGFGFQIPMCVQVRTNELISLSTKSVYQPT
jgi:hypothetical protein